KEALVFITIASFIPFSQAANRTALEWSNEEKDAFVQRAKFFAQSALSLAEDDRILQEEIIFTIKCPKMSGLPYGVAKVKMLVRKTTGCFGTALLKLPYCERTNTFPVACIYQAKIENATSIKFFGGICFVLKSGAEEINKLHVFKAGRWGKKLENDETVKCLFKVKEAVDADNVCKRSHNSVYEVPRLPFPTYLKKRHEKVLFYAAPRSDRDVEKAKKIFSLSTNEWPENPVERTGFSGLGWFPHFGPNHLVYVIATRGKGSKIEALHEQANGRWHLPYFRALTTDVTKETATVAMGMLWKHLRSCNDKEYAEITKSMETLQKGYLSIPSNTDNAWCVGRIVHVHDEQKLCFRSTGVDNSTSEPPKDRDLKWFPVDANSPLLTKYGALRDGRGNLLFALQ
ncbi:hypothetical protein M513_12224, partial [Trichuris suis]